jgi:hypothetical protein
MDQCPNFTSANLGLLPEGTKRKRESSIWCPRARLHAAATSKSAALRNEKKKLHNRGAVNYEKCRRAREPNHATHRTGLGRATNPPASRRPGRRGGRRIGERTGSSPDKRNEFWGAVEVRAASCWLPRNLGGSPRGDEMGDGNWRQRRRRERGEHGRQEGGAGEARVPTVLW